MDTPENNPSGPPVALGSTEGLGLAPERAAFEAWYSDGGKWPAAVCRSGDGYMLAAAQSAWTAWRAAADFQRERCAQVCRDLWNEQEAAHGNRAGEYHNGLTAGLDLAERRIRLEA